LQISDIVHYKIKMNNQA